jgi:DNA sulfur modification protein DndB
MSNRILIPALKAKVGDWDYYICTMKYAAVAREVHFAYELGGNTDLSSLIQRGISERTKAITDYLLRSEHRFLGALIVAAHGGEPNYTPVRMDDTEEYLKGLDDSFGVLTFDGSQQYFALDGQHRLRAIKDAILKNPSLGKEDITIILVSHYDTPQGKEKTRRLFTNINKNAKVTTKSENLALDEDDAFAIITRRLVNEHPFLSQEGRVSIFASQGNNGEMSLATQVKDNDRKAITSISQLYEMVRNLSVNTVLDGKSSVTRPTDDDLEAGYEQIADNLDLVLASCGDITQIANQNDDLRIFRKNKNSPVSVHPFLKGIVQRVVCEVVAEIVKSQSLDIEVVCSKLKSLEWKLGSSPWHTIARVQDEKVKILTGRDDVSMLKNMLKVHLFPNSKQQIIRARQDYKQLRNEDYPVSLQKLEENLSHIGKS